MRQNGVTALPRVAGPLLILGVVLAGTGLFCSQFEPLATTSPGVNAPTAEARTAIARTGWPIVLSDKFDKQTNDWETGETDDRFTTGSLQIAYVISNPLRGFRLLSRPIPSDGPQAF